MCHVLRVLIISELEMHAKSAHAADRPFQCLYEECDRTFKTAENRDSHVQRHYFSDE